MQLIQHELSVGLDGIHTTGEEESEMPYETILDNGAPVWAG